MYGKATRLDHLTQVTRMLSAQEMALGPLSLQGIGKGQAAHDVAAADLQRGVGAKGYQHVQPPSTTMLAPFMKLEASEIKKANGPWISSCWPIRPIGTFAANLATNCELDSCTLSFGKGPGEIAFTRMPSLPNSQAA